MLTREERVLAELLVSRGDASREAVNAYFVSDRSGSMNVWWVPIDPESGTATGPPRPVTHELTSSIHYLTIDSAGDRLAFTRWAYDEQLVRVPFDPEAARVEDAPQAMLNDSRPFQHPYPLKSGDGVLLATVSDRGTRRLAVIDAAEGGVKRTLALGFDNSSDLLARPSPDGELIAVQVASDGVRGIWTTRVDGRGVLRCTSIGGASNPVWHPDSRRLAFSVRGGVAREVRVDERGRCFGTRRLPIEDEASAAFEPHSWSPDGERIAGTTRRGVAILELSGGSLRTVTTSGAQPVWLPDGERLLYAAEGGIRLVDPRHGLDRAVLEAGSEKFNPLFSLSPEGHTLYASQYSLDADVWMIDGRGEARDTE